MKICEAFSSNHVAKYILHEIVPDKATASPEEVRILNTQYCILNLQTILSHEWKTALSFLLPNCLYSKEKEKREREMSDIPPQCAINSLYVAKEK